MLVPAQGYLHRRAVQMEVLLLQVLANLAGDFCMWSGLASVTISFLLSLDRPHSHDII